MRLSLLLGGPGNLQEEGAEGSGVATGTSTCTGEAAGVNSTGKNANYQKLTYASWLRPLMQEITTLHIPGKGVPFGELLDTLIAVRLGPQVWKGDRLYMEREPQQPEHETP